MILESILNTAPTSNLEELKKYNIIKAKMDGKPVPTEEKQQF